MCEWFDESSLRKKFNGHKSMCKVTNGHVFRKIASFEKESQNFLKSFCKWDFSKSNGWSM